MSETIFTNLRQPSKIRSNSEPQPRQNAPSLPSRTSTATAHPPNSPTQTHMDSFTPITATIVTDAPTNEDTGSGGGGNAYCVVSQSEAVPADEDTGSGGGGNAYCVVA
ncbi:hypothetical protein BJ912DRAFT_1148991 [Pholiota molesta]|nr:hypothetical protein BJ912DRAFT_1148991 [Pholiota molesta]